MDAVALAILLAELERDGAIVADAAHKAVARIDERADGHLEACAYELARLYNVFEKMLERVCLAFENHFEKRADFHEQLLQRLALPLPGIRPAFIPRAELSGLRELKGFRHRVRHAYDLVLAAPRLRELVNVATILADSLPTWCAAFGATVRASGLAPGSRQG